MYFYFEVNCETEELLELKSILLRAIRSVFKRPMFNNEQTRFLNKISEYLFVLKIWK